MLGHNDINEVFRGDLELKRFFEEISDELKNAYLIFMSDHGLRFGDITETRIGSIEENNPFLMISVPEKLRKNDDLMRQLKKNSKHLVTHYDTYATLAEIAAEHYEFTSKTSFSTKTFNPSYRTLKGSSFFHPLKQPRDCFSLLIPFEYCLCQREQYTIDNKDLALTVGGMILKIINDKVTKSKHKKDCQRLELKEDGDFEVIQIESGREEKVYLVTIETVNGAKYQGYVGKTNDKLKLYTTTFPRMNAYAEQAKCIPEQYLRHYCWCKS
ncbi:unnamed protein product [Bursaphelenchus okinawaensis]|uniref:Uncharacterized protein n=1 Tax=Bursaphelenchus okinawaensis TaxID=465554 RepID=A0A811L650_9BILA|nr:unnamed protein product [Bursaphelenchus okinawaensis]CAG9117309.1 unnamed protein product [Bursaphelenchus okinawaensis]